MGDTEKVIRIRVLAVADPSLKTAFVGLEEGARRAATKARKIVDGAQSAKGGAYRTNAAAYDTDVRAFEKAEADKRRIAERNFQTIQRIKSATFRNQQREEERSERDAERKQTERTERRRKTVRDFGKNLGRKALDMASGAAGAVGEAARGAGIDFSPATLMQRYVDAERRAIQVTNSGKLAKGEVATADDVKATRSSISTAADTTKRSRNEVAEGLDEFVAKSSDLEGGKALLIDIGKIANGTGAEFVDLASAAGSISQAMGDIPNKAERVAAMLRLITKQGALGTVEIKDLATLLPRLTATAGMFAGEWEVAFAEAGALTQSAIAGGRATPSEATNTAQSWQRDVTKPTTLKKLDAAGINVFSDASKTKLRLPSEVIADVLEKTKGNQAEVGKLLPNVVSRANVTALTGKWLEAERAGRVGGGRKAIQDHFKTFTKGVSKEDMDAMSALVENSTSGKAQGAQNRAEKMFGEGADKLLGNKEAMDKFQALTGSDAAVMAGLGASAIGGGGSNPLAALTTISVATLIVGTMALDSAREGHSKDESDSEQALKDISSLRATSTQLTKDAEGNLVPDVAAMEDAVKMLEAQRPKLEEGAKSAVGDSLLTAGVSSLLGGPQGVAAFSFLAPNEKTGENYGQAYQDNVAATALLQAEIAKNKPPTAAEIGAAVAAAIGGPGGPVVDQGPRAGTRF